MRTAETRGTAIVTGASGAIGAVYADSRATALQQVEQGVRLFPAVRQAKKRAS
jgi:short-subunit dehydrogenase